MGRTALVTAGVLVAMALGAPAATAQAPSEDAVTGSGAARFVSGGLPGATAPFAVDLRAGPGGQNPTGTFTLVLAFTDPTCLVISTTPVEEPPTATANLRNPVTGQRVVVRFSTVGGQQFIALRATDDAGDCALGTPATVAEVVDGQFSVVDAPPLPASQDDCRDGGWRAFGLRNQGQCMAFVQRGPRP